MTGVIFLFYYREFLDCRMYQQLILIFMLIRVSELKAPDKEDSLKPDSDVPDPKIKKLDTTASVVPTKDDNEKKTNENKGIFKSGLKNKSNDCHYHFLKKKCLRKLLNTKITFYLYPTDDASQAQEKDDSSKYR